MRAVMSSAVLECVGHDVRVALRGMVVWQTSVRRSRPIKTLTDRDWDPYVNHSRDRAHATAVGNAMSHNEKAHSLSRTAAL